MSTDEQKEAKSIRLVFELARADYPRLYDDLVQFHKGTKRINRLRLLAHDGLLVQSGLFNGVGNALPSQTSQRGTQEGCSDVTNDLFAPSIEG